MIINMKRTKDTFNCLFVAAYTQHNTHTHT